MASIMKPAVITFIICLLALHVEGLPICNCPYYIEAFDINSYINHHIYKATPSCPLRIIVFTATNGNGGECVNPESIMGKVLYDLKPKATVIVPGHVSYMYVGGGGSGSFVLLMLACIYCRKKKRNNSPTSDGEAKSEVHYATVQHPPPYTPQPPPEQIMLHPPPYTPHPPPEQIMLYSKLNVTSHQPGLDHPG